MWMQGGVDEDDRLDAEAAKHVLRRAFAMLAPYRRDMLVALAMVVSSLSAIVVLPQLVVWMQPAFLVGRRARRAAAAPAPVRTHIVFGEPAAPLASRQPTPSELDA